MGCAGSKADDGFEVQESAESREMNERLEKQQKEENAIVKLLVLGTGESGKSTVFKQMKILYSVPDPPSKFIMVVRANLFGNAQSVHAGMEKLGIAYGSDEGKKAGELISSKPADGNMPAPSREGSSGNVDPDAEIQAAFVTMLKDSGVAEAVERAAEYQLNDSTIYFWERASEILKADYMPTEQDVLRARVRTTGIVQQNFKIKDKQYTMFDVGGQRNERRKWIHCFDNVTAVIFVTAISEYDQVLYEDENTNRMDEALLLFDQICNHPSFQKTSMVLFLNKRDLFDMKLKKKDMSCWDPTTAASAGGPGQNYDRAIDFIKAKFLEKNKSPEKRQVYCHATCATDTSNVAFVMDSVFDIILKENLRKMDNVDVEALMSGDAATGKSAVKIGQATYAHADDTILLCAAWYTENLKSRDVLVNAANIGQLPTIEIGTGKIESAEHRNWELLMKVPKLVPAFGEVGKGELGSFFGNFKQGCTALRELLGVGPEEELGFVYDTPVYLASSKTTIINLVRCLPSSGDVTVKPNFAWKVHEEFMNAHLKAYGGVDTGADPCKAPDKNAEFNPFAANPVGANWFKGITLYTKLALATPDKGVYLGIMKVCSTTDGFKIMVNEHNRIMIPIIFISCSQLPADELKWMQGVRVRQDKGIDLLEGKKPNRGWLGPEMSGEEGATFPEKMWWAIDEGKARLGADDLGSLYDYEVLDVDENNNIQLVMYAMLASGEDDILPGHIWMSRPALEVQNMKYMCPKTLQALKGEEASLMDKYRELDAQEGGDFDAAQARRKAKEVLKEQISSAIKATTPLKWINRTIMWCADKMPSFAAGVTGGKDMDPPALVEQAVAKNTDTAANKQARQALLSKYNK